MSALTSQRVLARYLPSVVLFSAPLAAWQMAGPAFGIREYLLPGPLSVARAAVDGAIPWPLHVWITTVEIVGGFVLAGAGGVALGVAIAWSPVAAQARLAPGDEGLVTQPLELAQASDGLGAVGERPHAHAQDRLAAIAHRR